MIKIKGTIKQKETVTKKFTKIKLNPHATMGGLPFI